MDFASTVQGIMQSIQSPPTIHAISVHLPVALAFLGLPLVFLAAILPLKSPTLRILATASYLTLAVAAAASVWTGLHAEQAIPGILKPDVNALLHRHEEMAEMVWVFALVTTVLVAAGGIKATAWRALFNVLALIAATATALWVALVGHYGGTLVYTHGVNTPDAHYVTKEPTPPPVPAEPSVVVPDEFEPAIRPLDDTQAPNVSFNTDILPLFIDRCGQCHNAEKLRGGIDLTTYQAAVADPDVIKPGKPDESELVEYIRGIKAPQMPIGAPPLTEAELHRIRLWIYAGAANN